MPDRERPEHQDDIIIKTLQRELERLDHDYNETKKVLLKSIGERKRELLKKEPGYDFTKKVTPGQFAGIGIKDALQFYLLERGGGPVTRSRLAADLVIGGADLGTPSRHARHILITVSNNRGIFAYDEDTDTVRLVKSETVAKPPTRAKKHPLR